MNAVKHESCYGRLFPEMLFVPNDRRVQGKVFSLTLTTAGGLWRSGRQVDTDMDQWDACRACPDFDGCYQLSMGKLALEAAAAGR